MAEEKKSLPVIKGPKKPNTIQSESLKSFTELRDPRKNPKTS